MNSEKRMVNLGGAQFAEILLKAIVKIPKCQYVQKNAKQYI